MRVTAVQDRAGRRWRFATPSQLSKGALAKSVRTFATEREALAAGRKEFRLCR